MLRRQSVLEEHNATANGTHNLSSVAFEMTELGLECRTGSTDKETIVLLQQENQLQSVAITQQNVAITQLQAQVTQLLGVSNIKVVEPKSTLNSNATKGHKSSLTELPEGWEKLNDATSGVDYYANATTEESRWDAPPGSIGGSAGLVMRNNPLQTERNEL